MPPVLNPLIVIEALDAGGSQTQTNLLVKQLQLNQYKVLQLHFPQEDRATGRLIYEKFLLGKNKGRLSRREQALLYLQDFYSRFEEIAEIQARDGRYIVVSDRYCTSMFAYQTLGLAGAMRKKMLKWLHWLAYGDAIALPRPDLVIFLDTPVAVSLRRLQDKKKDYFETKAKLTAIRNSYLRLASENNWHTIPGVDEQGLERTRENLRDEIWKIAASLLHTA